MPQPCVVVDFEFRPLVIELHGGGLAREIHRHVVLGSFLLAAREIAQRDRIEKFFNGRTAQREDVGHVHPVNRPNVGRWQLHTQQLFQQIDQERAGLAEIGRPAVHVVAQHGLVDAAFNRDVWLRRCQAWATVFVDHPILIHRAHCDARIPRTEQFAAVQLIQQGAGSQVNTAAQNALLFDRANDRFRHVWGLQFDGVVCHLSAPAPKHAKSQD